MTLATRTKLFGNMLADAHSKHLFFLISISYTILATVSADQSIISVVHFFYSSGGSMGMILIV